ncbi:molybdopterin-synthase adenylyltransferase MoeB [Tessaracoccus sp. OS52]|uniref:molybdopterin-synthase adenylyltransferase MoeB n=1 Tax=Tessaracoccus sp. OS52 TaxID=2886691 RepID=UPI001D128B42|nr:molybdopterin-synthase adenylyltransferase MoeB [Tessaracoccus sp. OS52]
MPPDQPTELSRDELQRYSRQIMLPQLGLEGQRRLKEARVLVVGAGGLGSPALLYLAAAGVGTIGIVDDDVVDASNLQRQVIHQTSDVGRSKVASAAQKVRDLNPNATVIEQDGRLTSANALEVLGGYDLVLDGSDNFPTRYLVSDAAELLRQPCVWGAIFQFSGQVAVFHGGHGPTYRDVFPEPPEPGTVPSCAEGGVIGALPGLIGTAMANEAIKLVTGIGRSLLGRLVVLDALEFTWRELEIRPDPSREPVRELIDYDAWCGVSPAGATPSQTDSVGPTELAALLADRSAGRADFDLIDVREPGEHEIVHIDGARLVPLGRLVAGEALLDPEREVVVHCRTDVRARQARELLLAAGHSHVRYLRGGVLAWVSEVEPHKPSY